MLVVCTAANTSFQNPVEHCHAITNQGLQTIGVMRKSMASEMENYIKNANSDKEIRKLCCNSENLLHGLKESLNKPKHLIEDILQKLSLKGKLVEIYEPATTPQIKQYEDALVENFDENTLSSTLKTGFSQTKYPKFTEFYETHISRTYFSMYLNVLNKIANSINLWEVVW